MSEQRTDSFPWRVTAALPRTPHVTSMTWRHGLFVHWPIDPELLRPHVPEPLTLETWDGSAWLSVLPFVLTNVGLRGAPAVTKTAFAALNVRTYVSYRGDAGLFFFSIDVGSPLLAGVVGRTRLPVHYANMRVSGDGSEIAFSSRRRPIRPSASPSTAMVSDNEPGWFEATYRPVGETFTAEPNTFEYWTSERQQFYASEAGGVLTAEIGHEPWPLQPADVTIHENTMFEANGLPTPTGSPRAYYCDELPMTGSVPRWIRSSSADVSHRGRTANLTRHKAERTK